MLLMDNANQNCRLVDWIHSPDSCQSEEGDLGPAVIFDDGLSVKKINYKQLRDIAFNVSTVLFKNGCDQRCIIGCVMENNICIPSIIYG